MTQATAAGVVATRPGALATFIDERPCTVGGKNAAATTAPRGLSSGSQPTVPLATGRRTCPSTISAAALMHRRLGWQSRESSCLRPCRIERRRDGSGVRGNPDEVTCCAGSIAMANGKNLQREIATLERALRDARKQTDAVGAALDDLEGHRNGLAGAPGERTPGGGPTTRRGSNSVDRSLLWHSRPRPKRSCSKRSMRGTTP